MQMISMPFKLLRDAEQARQRKREWRWQAVCAGLVALVLIFLALSW